MPNLAAPFKSAVLAQFPNATIDSRGRNFIRHQVGAHRFVLDCTHDSIHYFDGGAWQEANTDWAEPDDVNFADMCKTIGPLVYSDASGKRRIYPRRSVLTEFVEFARPQFWTGTAWQDLVVGARTRTGDTLLWDRAHFSISLRLGGSQCKVEVVLKDAQAANRVRWPVTLTGLSLSGWTLVSTNDSVTVLELHQPWMLDANGTKGAVSASIVNGAVEFNADLTGLTFPITIDPTIDSTVGAGGDDGYLAHDFSFDNTDVEATAGYSVAGPNRTGTFARFTSVAVSQGSTINAGTILTIQRAFANSGGAATVRVEAAANDNAPAPTTIGTFNVTRTTANVAWTLDMTTTSDFTSPDINTVISEVIARAGWASGNALVVFVEGNADSGGYARIKTFESSASLCPRLHIDYTAAVPIPAVNRSDYLLFPKTMMRPAR